MESVNELTWTRTQCTTAGIDLESANEQTQTRKMHNSNIAKHLLNAPDPLHCKQLALPTPQALQGGLAALQCLPMALRPAGAPLIATLGCMCPPCTRL